jgi:predicted transcriptional regulator
MTISLPPEMAMMIATLRKRQHSTNSELIRQALREYFYSQFPVYEPTKAELKAIQKGREDFKKGNYISLEELRHELDIKNHRNGAKRPAKNSSKRRG